MTKLLHPLTFRIAYLVRIWLGMTLFNVYPLYAQQSSSLAVKLTEDNLLVNQLTFQGSTIYFAGYDSRTNSYGLYRYDGQTTTKLTEGKLSVDKLTAVGSSLYFIGYDNSTHSSDLYKYEGETTIRLTKGNLSFNSELTVVGSTIYFEGSEKSTGTAGLYRCDGKDTFPIAFSTTFDNLTVSELTPVGSTIYFSGYHYDYSGVEAGLYRYDDGQATTKLTEGILFTRELTVVGSSLYFIGNDYTTRYTTNTSDLYKYEGQSITKLTRGNLSGSQLLAIGSDLYFAGYDKSTNTSGLYKQQGTATSKLTEGDLRIEQLIAIGVNLFFRVYDASTKSYGLYRYDGQTTTRLTSGNLTVSKLIAVGSSLYFISDDNNTNLHGLYKQEGQITTKLTVGNLAVRELTVVGSSLFFNGYDYSTNSYGLYKQEGLMSNRLTEGDLAVSRLTSIGSSLYFIGTNQSGTLLGLYKYEIACSPPLAELIKSSDLSCSQAAVILTATPTSGATYSFRGPPTATINRTDNTATVDKPGTYTVVVTSSNSCSASSTIEVSLPLPPAVSLVTQSGQLYPGNQSSVEVAQFSGFVSLVSSGCSGGTIKWQGPANQSGTGSLQVATASTGTFTYSARCQQGECLSTPVSATVVVKPAPLQLVAPVFDCASGTLTLRTLGGNGQAIEYQIAGVTQGWSAQNPVVLSAKQTTKPLKLNARQRTATKQGFDTADLTYSVPACGSARLGIEEATRPELTVRVLGNPVTGSVIKLAIAGAEGSWVNLQLTDLTGRLLIEQQIDRAGALEECQLPSDKIGSGLFLIHVVTPLQAQTIKVITNPN